jgi:RecA/RadA recombinase
MAGILSKQFRDSVSKHKDSRMKDESTPSVSYSTGFLNFDFMNGSVVHVKSSERNFKYYSVGIQDGSMAMLIGRSGSGKTTFAVQAGSNIVRQFPNACIFHDDIEGGVTEYRKEVLSGMRGEELNSKYISRNTGITAENFYERLRMIHDIKLANREAYEYDTGYFDPNGNRLYKLEPTVYILDSVALLMPAQYTEEEELSGSMSATAAAKTNSMSFKRIIPMLKAANIILLIINHINKKIDINPMQRTKSQVSYLKQDESLPGGNTIIYLSNLLLRFDDNSKLKEDEAFGIAGNLVDITLVKSRNNRAGKSCTLVFNQNQGFDPELSLFIMLKNAKRINGAGAYLYIGNRSDIKFSQKTFKDKLKENPELRQIFIQEVMDMLKAELDASDTANEIREYDYSLSTDILSQINPDISV